MLMGIVCLATAAFVALKNQFVFRPNRRRKQQYVIEGSRKFILAGAFAIIGILSWVGVLSIGWAVLVFGITAVFIPVAIAQPLELPPKKVKRKGWVDPGYDREGYRDRYGGK